MTVKLFEDQESLYCAYCGKNLFENPKMSIVVIIEDREGKEIKDIYACCKGQCDRVLLQTRVKKNGSDGWRDITDFLNPVLFLQHIMAMMNNMQSGKKISEEAFESYKQILLSTAPYVMRKPTKEEESTAVINNEFPF